MAAAGHVPPVERSAFSSRFSGPAEDASYRIDDDGMQAESRSHPGIRSGARLFPIGFTSENEEDPWFGNGDSWSLSASSKNLEPQRERHQTLLQSIRQFYFPPHLQRGRLMHRQPRAFQVPRLWCLHLFFRLCRQYRLLQYSLHILLDLRLLYINTREQTNMRSVYLLCFIFDDASLK